MAKPVNYWHRLDDGRLECAVCPRACRLKDGQAGFCVVRQRQGDTMVLSTYGRSSGFCLDPIEKKPLNQFLPGTPTLSFGTAGCNLGCQFCQNWDLSRARELDRLQDAAPPDKIARAARALGCRSIAYTYNDPVIFTEYAGDIAQAAAALGVKSVAVTAGYIHGRAREDFFRHMDAANVDLKAFTERFYQELCQAHLAPILETLEYLARETKVWLELTTLLIPGENDSARELEDLTQWVVGHLGPHVPMHFTAFHPDYRLTDRPATPPATLTRARQIARRNGVRYAYTGNVHDPAGASTYCHQCGKLLIGRDGYVLGEWHLDHGTCRYCGTPCAGVFDPEPGTWGARRQPVQLAALDV